MDNVRSLEVASENVHGRSIVNVIRVLAHLWGLYSADLATVLSPGVVAAINTLVAALGAIEAINPPGPE